MPKNIMMFLEGRNVLKQSIKFIIWGGYFYFSFLLLLITIQYIPYKTDVAFLELKQDIIGLTHYKIAFFTHVYTSIFLMVLGFLQFSKYIQKKYISLHRISGKLYGIIVVFLSGPSGFVMAIYANGGIIAQTSFVLLSLFWILFTAISIVYIWNKNIEQHQKFAIRSFALTLSAITLRITKWSVVHFFDPLPMDAYRIAAWVSWTLNLIIAEIIIFFWFSKKQKKVIIQE